VTDVADELELNLGEIPSGEFEAIPSGTYNAVIFGRPEIRKGRDSGEPYINVEYHIKGGPHDSRKLWGTISLQKQSLWKAKTILERFGRKDLAESTSVRVSQIIEALAGQACQIVVVAKMKDGKNVNDITETLPPSADGTVAAETKDLF